MLRIKNMTAFNNFMMNFFSQAYNRAKNGTASPESINSIALTSGLGIGQAFRIVDYLLSLDIVRESEQRGRSGCRLFIWNLNKCILNDSLKKSILENATARQTRSSENLPKHTIEEIRACFAEPVDTHQQVIDSLTDQELVDILRQRGWTVIAERQITQSL